MAFKLLSAIKVLNNSSALMVEKATTKEMKWNQGLSWLWVFWLKEEKLEYLKNNILEQQSRSIVKICP